MDNKELYANAFVYPSQQEWKDITDSFPVVNELTFKGNDNLIDKSYENEIYRFIANNDILPWVNRLNNKLSKLRFSYVLSKYYKLKGIPDINWVKNLENGRSKYFPDFTNKGHYYLKFLFNYSCEAFYYHYISSLDILMHLINIFYNLGVEENSPRFNEYVGKRLEPKNPQLFKILDSFRKTNIDIYGDRKDLAHNFPFFEVDFRSQKLKEKENGKEVIHMGLEKYTTSKEAINKIGNRIIVLAVLLKEIEKELK